MKAQLKTLIAELRDEALRAHDGLQTTGHADNWREVEAVYKEQFRIADRLAAILAEEAGGWTEGEPPPPDRLAMYYVRMIEVFRWLPYRPDGARQMRRSGRWQKHQGYGFENHEWPDGVQWRPVPPPTEPAS